MKDYRLKENQRYECDSCHKIFSWLICKPEWNTEFLCEKCFEKINQGKEEKDLNIQLDSLLLWIK